MSTLEPALAQQLPGAHTLVLEDSSDFRKTPQALCSLPFGAVTRVTRSFSSNLPLPQAQQARATPTWANWQQ